MTTCEVHPWIRSSGSSVLIPRDIHKDQDWIQIYTLNEAKKKNSGSRISPTLPSLRTNMCLFTYGGGSELLFPFEGVYLLTAFLIGLSMQFVLLYLLYRFVRKSRSVEREVKPYSFKGVWGLFCKTIKYSMCMSLYLHIHTLLYRSTIVTQYM